MYQMINTMMMNNIVDNNQTNKQMDMIKLISIKILIIIQDHHPVQK